MSSLICFHLLKTQELTFPWSISNCVNKHPAIMEHEFVRRYLNILVDKRHNVPSVDLSVTWQGHAHHFTYRGEDVHVTRRLRDLATRSDASGKHGNRRNTDSSVNTALEFSACKMHYIRRILLSSIRRDKEQASYNSW